MQMIPYISRGYTVADLFSILGAMDYVLADIDSVTKKQLLCSVLQKRNRSNTRSRQVPVKKKKPLALKR